jgi:hypothetical protein
MGRENAPPPAQGRKNDSSQAQQFEQQQQQQCNGSSSSSSNSSDAGSFAAHTLPLCFAMMAELREDVHWSSSQESEGSAGEVRICIRLHKLQITQASK